MSTLKVDTVRPVTTDGSLSLKGDSGGSATTNGISVDSSGDTSITGTTTTSTASLDGAVVINDSGADVDFRVESDTVDHALFVQGSDGYVGIGVSSPADKLHVDGNIRLTSGSGINFSAYGAEEDPDNTATDVTSNLLNDYEEGTWDPECYFGPGTTTGFAGTQVGRYIKIGNLVNAFARIVLTSKGTATGVFGIQNLPFSQVNAANFETGAPTTHRTSLVEGSFYTVSNATYTSSTYTDAAVSNNTAFTINFIYEVV